jgi:hypothetical protein
MQAVWERIAAYTAALNGIAARLGIDLADLLKDEDRDRITRTLSPLEPETVRDWTQADLDGWFDVLGSALAIKVRTSPGPDGPSTQEWAAGVEQHKQAYLQPLITDCDTYRNVELDCSVTVTKTGSQMLADLAPLLGAEGFQAAEELAVILFLSGGRLQSILSRHDYRSFEKRFLKVPAHGGSGVQR